LAVVRAKLYVFDCPSRVVYLNRVFFDQEKKNLSQPDD
jgi:hypothetical protein